MKTLLFLDDELISPKLLLQNGVAPAKRPIREVTAVAGCNCDRWGHPCLGGNEHNARRTSELSVSAAVKQ